MQVALVRCCLVGGRDLVSVLFVAANGEGAPMKRSEPSADWADVTWAGLAIAAVLGTVYMAAGYRFDPLWTLLWAVVGSFAVLGAWRRTIWGCPHSHRAESQEPPCRHL